jgi:pyrimidine-nucleoside phosphorylase
MALLRPQDVIARKRDGQVLSPEEITGFLQGYTRGEIADYQAAALLMAIFFRGLAPAELTAWTETMLRSGDVLDLSAIAGVKVDKHSTGGVGDKISLPLAPLVAACGVPVPMISGRGLGHTGGTLDKLESIEGFRVDLSVQAFIAQVQKIGVAMIGQTAQLAPADKKLYALRDVTATIESIPLIASSIMSKKLAAGVDALVLDVKVGRGAFMKQIETARALARTMIAIGRSVGRTVVALLTRMDEPIGREVGNASEVREAIEVLHGKGPSDTVELTMALGAEMLVLGGVSPDQQTARATLAEAISSGRAAERMAQMIAAQGGDARVIEDPSRLPLAEQVLEVTAPEDGILTQLDAERVGQGAMIIGAGRVQVADRVDPAVGVTVLCKLGDPVRRGQPVALLRHRGDGREVAAAELIASGLRVEPEAGPHSRLLSPILERLLE